ncbi:dynein regulatory complex protein 8 isoform X2 [Acanthopagrus latus]|uniref:dynein regulatory complex protein 8 isoform X2 n=1 Tax=Acanthopagrus latus TaxID=8177 RepID=UPI00187C642E|nr:dynein regulatory complex protein 8 isoform X2 [Acanthopagrus latus]
MSHSSRIQARFFLFFASLAKTDWRSSLDTKQSVARQQNYNRTSMAEDKPKSERMVSDVHKRIKAAFEAFDYESNNTVDVREISTIIYSLGCFPNQEDLHAFIAKVEEDHTGYIHLDKFLPAMTKVLLEHKFPPIPEDVLLQAFEVLDKEKKGYLEPEELTKYMTQEGWKLVSPSLRRRWMRC